MTLICYIFVFVTVVVSEQMNNDVSGNVDDHIHGNVVLHARDNVLDGSLNSAESVGRQRQLMHVRLGDLELAEERIAVLAHPYSSAGLLTAPG